MPKKTSKYTKGRRAGRPAGARNVPSALRYFLAGAAACRMYPYDPPEMGGPLPVAILGASGLKSWAQEAVITGAARGCVKVMDPLWRVADMAPDTLRDVMLSVDDMIRGAAGLDGVKGYKYAATGGGQGSGDRDKVTESKCHGRPGHGRGPARDFIAKMVRETPATNANTLRCMFNDAVRTCKRKDVKGIVPELQQKTWIRCLYDL
eukprot:gene11061-3586_t